MLTKKPKIFLYGGCDLYDMGRSLILRREFDVIDHSIAGDHIDESSLDFAQQTFPITGRGLTSLYTPPGEVALRVAETLENLSPNKRKSVAPIYKEVFKFPILDYFKKNACDKDYLLLSFSPEVYTKFYNSKECFTLNPPSFTGITEPNHCLHWLYKEYLTKETFLLAFDEAHSLYWTNTLIPDFTRDLYEIFQDRILIIASHFSNFLIDNDYSIKKYKSGPKDILFYKQTKIVTDPLDYSYAQRSCELLISKFKKEYKSDVRVIRLNEIVFIDANHRWGPSQFHIDLQSRTKLAELTYAEIKKHMSNKVCQN